MPDQVSAIVVSYQHCRLCSIVPSSRCMRTSELVDGVEIIVVDNASDDGSPRMVRERFPAVRAHAAHAQCWVRSGDQRGTAHGARRTASVAQPGCRASARRTANALCISRRAPVASSCGTATHISGWLRRRTLRSSFPGMGQILLDFFPIHSRIAEIPLEWTLRPLDREPFADRSPIGCMHADIAVRASLDDVGLLDEGFFMYCEEVDWCMRARERGWEIYHRPWRRG